MKNIFYFSLKYFLRYYNQIFFRDIKEYGYQNIPKDGGVLFSPNHQGAFLDPLLIGSMTPKKITSLTRSDVFGGPLQWFLDALQMLPVYRIRNGYSNLKKNDITFKKCFELLGEGKFLMMFSEGGHHDEYYLKKLSKGSSRLAYQAQNYNNDKKIYILPVGINYGHHKQTCTTLHLVYGKPLLVSDFIDSKLNEAENINLIREELQIRMQACLWLPFETEKYHIQKECINRITTKMSFDDLKKALRESLSDLPKRRNTTKIGSILTLVLSIPNIIPLWITRKIINQFDDKVFVSSMKYALGAFLFPIWWLFTSVFIAYYFGNSMMTIYLSLCIVSILIRQRILLS